MQQDLLKATLNGLPELPSFYRQADELRDRPTSMRLFAELLYTHYPNAKCYVVEAEGIRGTSSHTLLAFEHDGCGFLIDPFYAKDRGEWVASLPWFKDAQGNWCPHVAHNVAVSPMGYATVSRGYYPGRPNSWIGEARSFKELTGMSLQQTFRRLASFDYVTTCAASDAVLCGCSALA